MKNYEELLEEAYAKIPAKTHTKERFEMPAFKSFVQGKQTVIQNFGEVADILRRDPNHLLKFITKELATVGNQDGKRAKFQGKFREDQINQRLKAYIEEFIICNECKKPDTQLITFEGVKYKRCEVCGARAPVKAI